MMTARGYSPTMRAQRIYALRAFPNWAARNGLASCRYLDAVQAPKTPRRIPWVPSPEQMAALVSAPDTVAYPRLTVSATGFMRLRDRAILETMYATGVRAGELCGMGLSDFPPGVPVGKVTGKGSHERLVMIHDRALIAIDRWRQLRQTYHPGHKGLWIRPDGRKLNRMGLFQLVRRYGRAIELPHDISPHTIRHAAATYLLGHASITTTLIYTHISTKALRTAHRKYHPRHTRKRKRPAT